MWIKEEKQSENIGICHAVTRCDSNLRSVLAKTRMLNSVLYSHDYHVVGHIRLTLSSASAMQFLDSSVIISGCDTGSCSWLSSTKFCNLLLVSILHYCPSLKVLIDWRRPLRYLLFMYLKLPYKWHVFRHSPASPKITFPTICIEAPQVHSLPRRLALRSYIFIPTQISNDIIHFRPLSRCLKQPQLQRWKTGEKFC